MKKLIVICAALLALQLGLAVWINLRVSGDLAVPASGMVFTIDAAAVDTLLLEEAGGTSLRLKKVDGRWLLTDLGDFPADSARVQGLVERIAGLQRGWPEATTAEAASRFKVAANGFEHRLTLSSGGTSARVYFGTSAGPRRVYLRSEGEDDILSMEVEARELETGADNWIDTGVLQREPGQVARLELPGLTLVRQGETLVPEGLAEGEEVVVARRDALVKRVTGLSVESVLVAADPAGVVLADPALQFTVVLTSGERLDYVFGQPPQAGPMEQGEAAAVPVDPTFVLRVTGQDRLFRVDGWQVDEIRHLNRAALVQPKAAPGITAPADPAPAESVNSSPATPVDNGT
ncbi:MAG: DUF4340 domain-containing protein [Desulfobulbus sp.]|jgi:hypothetical protein|nr:DUF4340 domain-containing protein [Desulfobulbus sp.]